MSAPMRPAQQQSSKDASPAAANNTQQQDISNANQQTNAPRQHHRVLPNNINSANTTTPARQTTIQGDQQHQQSVVTQSSGSVTVAGSAGTAANSSGGSGGGGGGSSGSSAKPQDSTNFEYDDNEWDIGIGDLIIDLDADIEKTAEGGAPQPIQHFSNTQAQQQMSSTHQHSTAAGTTVGPATNQLQNSVTCNQNQSNNSTGVNQNQNSNNQISQSVKPKMAVEHSATVDKGLKMKIKRTKPGTKTSEAKHEIVKSNEQNGNLENTATNSTSQSGDKNQNQSQSSNKHQNNQQQNSSAQISSAQSSAKRGSSSHRRDKTKEKIPTKSNNSSSNQNSNSGNSNQSDSVNGVVKFNPTGNSNPRPTTPQRPSNPPQSANTPGPPSTNQPQQNISQINLTSNQTVKNESKIPIVIMPSPSVAQASQQTSNLQNPQSAQTTNAQQTTTAQTSSAQSTTQAQLNTQDDRSSSPPPAKKLKTEPKGMLDVCVGTSVGTITEPDCLGPCEPGTSVTLEGIVWHETEGGVLVVNVTWRGKTYVGTLLDCTRHDWAPPRFCDSPTSDLDARTPKGRAKRGRAAANTTPGNDLSNFTETRSSLHSKLRNGGGKGRRGQPPTPTSNSGSSTSNSTGTSSPTPFLPPRNTEVASNKRKSRTGEEEGNVVTTTVVASGKKTRVASASTQQVSGSPPASPVLLECPEPNCSKKYKHINGLKYHQSHAHGSAEDEDTKDVTSMSENDESNIEAPSPITPVKSPEKVNETQPPTPVTPVKKEDPLAQTQTQTPLGTQTPLTTLQSVSDGGQTVCSETPRSTPQPQIQPQSPQTPVSANNPTTTVEQTNNVAINPTQNVVDSNKGVVKPGVLRFGPQEDYPMGNFSATKTPTSNVGSISNNVPSLTTVRSVNVTIPTQPTDSPQNSPFPVMPPQVAQPNSNNQPLTQNVSQNINLNHQTGPLINQNIPQSPQNPSVMNHMTSSNPQNVNVGAAQQKLPQFKVKPTAALMPEDKNSIDKNKNANVNFNKKKSRKSPAGSPLPPEQRVFGNMENSGREEVQSPAYSDISDDGAPVENEDKNKVAITDKKVETAQGIQHSMPQYGMYPFYGQGPYMVPPVQQQVQQEKPKDSEKPAEKPGEKDAIKKEPEFPQKILPQHPYYPYGYVPGYPYNIEPNYGAVSMVPEDKIKEERIKESPSPAEHSNKPVNPIPNPIQVPTPGKVKTEPVGGGNKNEKHSNENHQILKESIEMKNQMSSYMYQRQQQQNQTAHVNHHHHSQGQHNQNREEEMRRYYLYPDQQRRKENPPPPEQNQVQQNPKAPTPNKGPPQSPSVKHKDKVDEKKKEEPIKQEGVKPTMETQGPPPPPTSQYAYIHPSYMQSPHYGALPFDPNHPMYRSMLVTGPYSGNPYLHPQIPRYHAPEDLSRAPQGPTKALDLLQHHANQYYTSHKIHELQERAIKSPTPKTSVASSSPSSNPPPPTSGAPGPPISSQGTPTSQSQAQSQGSQGNKTPSDSNKDSRSPPPQRHVHTHHHTHVGLGYPLYPAPYGAAVLASQQAAAVTVINPYPPK